MAARIAQGLRRFRLCWWLGMNSSLFKGRRGLDTLEGDLFQSARTLFQRKMEAIIGVFPIIERSAVILLILAQSVNRESVD